MAAARWSLPSSPATDTGSSPAHVVANLVDRQLDVGVLAFGLVPPALAARGEPHRPECTMRVERRRPPHASGAASVGRGLVAIVRLEVDQLPGVVERELRANRQAG